MLGEIILYCRIGKILKKVIWKLPSENGRAGKYICDFNHFKSTLQCAIVGIQKIEYTDLDNVTWEITKTSQLYVALTECILNSDRVDRGSNGVDIKDNRPALPLIIHVQQTLIIWDYNTLPLPFGVSTQKCSVVLENLFSWFSEYYECLILVNGAGSSESKGRRGVAPGTIHHRCYDLNIRAAYCSDLGILLRVLRDDAQVIILTNDPKYDLGFCKYLITNRGGFNRVQNIISFNGLFV